MLGFSAQALATTDVASVTQPNWNQLSQEQRTVLRPLADDWAGMGEFRRKQWIGIAQRYHGMSPDEKARVDQRMKDWDNLSPEQRSQARSTFKSLKQVSPDHKEDIKRKWEEYSQLPEDQRAQLRADSVRKPGVKPMSPPPNSPPLKQNLVPKSPLLPAPAKPASSPASLGNGVSPAPTGLKALPIEPAKPTTPPATPGQP
jgi:Protein of unknown function (DUF3106)